MCDLNYEKVIKIFSEIYPENKPMVEKCPDQFVGKYNANHTISQTERKNIDYDYNYENKIIAIILESPHKNEYYNGTPLGPANGTTGRLFFNKAANLFQNSNILQSFIERKSYDIVFINAVQYQTSQGNKLNCMTGKLSRDNAWLKIYKEAGGEKNLQKRISQLNPEIAINLCTKGLSNLQLYVDRTLNVEKYKYTIGTHPSTWNFKYAHIE